MPSATAREDALRILDAGIRAADPAEAIVRQVTLHGGMLRAGGAEYDLSAIRRIVVVGAGKASANMAGALERVLGHRIHSGLINTKYGHTAELSRIRLNECGHPVPDEAGVNGTRQIAEIAAGATEDDLLICLISGGASALLPYPAEGVSLADKQAVTGLLLACGADIQEINTVRKHISRIKGGQLAALAWPASVLSLILSDVIGDDLDVIGSGITAPDRSTFGDALRVMAKYNLLERIPDSVRRHLLAGAAETPKPGHPAFQRTRNIVVGSTRLALEASAAEAERLGYNTMILSSFIEGETREVARVHAAVAKEIEAARRPVAPPGCVLSGGETTVTIRGNGKGGRNQEFVLAAALDISALRGTTILSAGTDGTDGPTDAAGAICDQSTMARARALSLNAREYLDRNDSYHFFDRLGDLIKTGPTGTNVMDLRIILVNTGADADVHG